MPEVEPRSSESGALVTVDETCALLALSRATVYRLMSAGELPSLQAGIKGARRIRRSDLDRFIERRLSAGAAS